MIDDILYTSLLRQSRGSLVMLMTVNVESYGNNYLVLILQNHMMLYCYFSIMSIIQIKDSRHNKTNY